MTSFIIKEGKANDPLDPPPLWAAKLFRPLLGLLILAILYSIYFVGPVLLPLAIALLLSALLHPLVGLLGRVRIPDALGAAMVVMGLVGILGFASYRLSLPAAEWLKRSPSLLWEAEFKLRTLKQTLLKAKEATQQLEKAAELGGSEGKKRIVLQEPSMTDRIISHARSFLFSGFITLVLLYFILARGRLTFERFISSLTVPEQSESWKKLFFHIHDEIARYLVTITLINAGLGIATTLVLALLGMPNPVLWGVLATILNFIPYLGGLIMTMILGIVSLISFNTLGRILLPPLIFLLLTGLEGQFVTPMLLGRRLSLNPLVLMISLLFWGWIWGIPGMLLAVPIHASLKIISKNIPSMNSIREILR